ncbi:MAG: hypothetical protein V5783_12685 [Pontiella sp.]
MNKIISIMMLYLLAGGAAKAAVISWEIPENIDLEDPTGDVSSNGILLYAYNFGDQDAGNGVGTTVTLGGTTFTTLSDSQGDDIELYNESGVEISFGTNMRTDTLPGGTTYDSANSYHQLLGSFQYNADETYSYLLNGLTWGTQYEVQFWSSDDRTVNRGQYLDGNRMDTTAGQYMIGTFTANEAFQAISLVTSASDETGQMAAMQIRAIPEPGTLGLIAIFGGVILFIRRHLLI